MNMQHNEHIHEQSNQWEHDKFATMQIYPITMHRNKHVVLNHDPSARMQCVCVFLWGRVEIPEASIIYLNHEVMAQWN